MGIEMISEQVPDFELLSWKCWWNVCDVTQKPKSFWKSPPCSHIAAFPCRCQTWGCFQPPAASERCHDRVRAFFNHGSCFFWLCQPLEDQSYSVSQCWVEEQLVWGIAHSQLSLKSTAVGCAGCFLGEGSRADSGGHTKLTLGLQNPFLLLNVLVPHH